MVHEKDVRVTVRDGIDIGARIYRPDGDGPFPALFAVSPYRYDNDDLPAYPLFLWRETGPIAWYVEHGYAYVHADTRGTGFSQGEYGFLDRAEQNDLYDVIEWIAEQPWCNGKIGGIGQSYYAMTQWWMGIMQPPHLTCIAPYDGLVDPYRFMGYPGGIEGNFLPYWYAQSVRLPNKFPANRDHPRTLPRDLPFEFSEHPLYDAFWQERSAVDRLHEITVPVYSIGVWAKLDLHLRGNMMGYAAARGEKHLAITGTATAFSSMLDFADVSFHERYLLPFYDRYLKEIANGFESRSAIEYVVKNTGDARSADRWPPPKVRERTLYLDAGPSGSVTSLNDGSLDERPPTDASVASTSYSYPDPRWVLGVVAVGPEGPDPVRAVLTFTSPALQDDCELTGSPSAILFVSTSGTDTDLVLKLSEQFAQDAGERAAARQPRSVIVTKGWLRASHAHERDPRHDTPEYAYYMHARVNTLTPGNVYEIVIPLQPIAWRFRRGSRIRFEVANGDSPVTDGLFFHAYRPDKIGTDTIEHNPGHRSRLVLPMMEVS